MIDRTPQVRSAREVLDAFLRLGCLSFGGPIAHLGYFHTEFVERRKWCGEATFAEIVAIAQSMPGPASSQVGFALGLLRAGWPGGLAAWVGFTMPSALLMLAFALGLHLFTGRVGLGIVHGLQLVAVAIVAQAIVSMRKSLAPDAFRMAVALVAAAIAFFAPPSSGTLLAIVAGALLGWLGTPKAGGPHPPSVGECGVAAHSPELRFGLPKLAGFLAAAMFFALLLLLPLAAGLVSSQAHSVASQSLAVFNAFYRTGALVFGGGHVVLPLLENAVVARGWIDQPAFLSGYGAAQAVPGPLFTFSAYLGAVIRPTFNPLALSAIALIAIFLPGLLVIVAVLPFWNELRQQPLIQVSLRGVNAAVVGVLVAAFIRPVCSSAVHSALDCVVALGAFALLMRWKVAPWIVVVSVATVSAIVSVI
jgi:chromate transporter